MVRVVGVEVRRIAEIMKKISREVYLLYIVTNELYFLIIVLISTMGHFIILFDLIATFVSFLSRQLVVSSVFLGWGRSTLFNDLSTPDLWAFDKYFVSLTQIQAITSLPGLYINRCMRVG